MAAIAVRFDTPAIVIGEGVVTVRWDDGSYREFADVPEMLAWFAGQLPSVEQVQAMAVINRLAADPMVDSPSLWDNKLVTFDPEQATPGNVFRVQ
jgi:hypothetical protein